MDVKSWLNISYYLVKSCYSDGRLVPLFVEPYQAQKSRISHRQVYMYMHVPLCIRICNHRLISNG